MPERRCAVVDCDTFPDAAWSLCAEHLAQIEAEVEADHNHANGAGAVGSGIQRCETATDRLGVAAIEDTDSPSSPPRPTTHVDGGL